MPGDIRFDQTDVIVEGPSRFEGETRFSGPAAFGADVTFKGSSAFIGKITSVQYEIESQGNTAGLAFTDRADLIPNRAKGHRWVWYCSKQIARLWSGGDLVTVQWGLLDQPLLTIRGRVDADDLTLGDMGSMRETIGKLTKEVQYLRGLVDKLCEKTGIPLSLVGGGVDPTGPLGGAGKTGKPFTPGPVPPVGKP